MKLIVLLAILTSHYHTPKNMVVIKTLEKSYDFCEIDPQNTRCTK